MSVQWVSVSEKKGGRFWCSLQLAVRAESNPFLSSVFYFSLFQLFLIFSLVSLLFLLTFVAHPSNGHIRPYYQGYIASPPSFLSLPFYSSTPDHLCPPHWTLPESLPLFHLFFVVCVMNCVSRVKKTTHFFIFAHVARPPSLYVYCPVYTRMPHAYLGRYDTPSHLPPNRPDSPQFEFSKKKHMPAITLLLLTLTATELCSVIYFYSTLQCAPVSSTFRHAAPQTCCSVVLLFGLAFASPIPVHQDQWHPLHTTKLQIYSA